jgi:hypothetical protein
MVILHIDMRYLVTLGEHRARPCLVDEPEAAGAGRVPSGDPQVRRAPPPLRVNPTCHKVRLYYKI